MRIIWLSGVAALLLTAIAFSKKPVPPSLDHLADQVERLDTIPNATRNELTRLIERTNREAKVSGIDERNAAAVARIERAMQFKPVERSSK